MVKIPYRGHVVFYTKNQHWAKPKKQWKNIWSIMTMKSKTLYLVQENYSKKKVQEKSIQNNSKTNINSKITLSQWLHSQRCLSFAHTYDANHYRQIFYGGRMFLWRFRCSRDICFAIDCLLKQICSVDASFFQWLSFVLVVAVFMNLSVIYFCLVFFSDIYGSL